MTWSSMVWFCRRAPHRAVGTAYGTPDMTSTPPATMTSARPALIIAMPETTASMAETQTRSMDTAVAVTGMPASMAAERATLLVRYGSKQLPEAHVVHVARLDAGAGHGLTDDRGGEQVRGHVLEGAAEGADGRAAGGRDDYVVHQTLPREGRPADSRAVAGAR